MRVEKFEHLVQTAALPAQLGRKAVIEHSPHAPLARSLLAYVGQSLPQGENIAKCEFFDFGQFETITNVL
jgi:hypothetical protein